MNRLSVAASFMFKKKESGGTYNLVISFRVAYFVFSLFYFPHGSSDLNNQCFNRTILIQHSNVFLAILAKKNQVSYRAGSTTTDWGIKSTSDYQNRNNNFVLMVNLNTTKKH